MKNCRWLLAFLLATISISGTATCTEPHRKQSKIYIHKDDISVIRGKILINTKAGLKTSRALYSSKKGFYVYETDLQDVTKK
jgi:hypothetical protein